MGEDILETSATRRMLAGRRTLVATAPPLGKATTADFINPTSGTGPRPAVAFCRS